MNTYVVFDLETTGLSIKDAEIIEISALKVIHNKVIDEFSTLVKPINPISQRTTSITGITNEMVALSPKIEEIFDAFFAFIEDYPLVGYNISSYDLPILNRYANKLYNTSIKNEHIDALLLARKKLPFLPNRTLSTVATYFSLNTDNAHRALVDCHMTNICYQKLQELPEQNIPVKRAAKKNRRNPLSKQTIAIKELVSILQKITINGKLDENHILTLQDWLSSNTFLSGQYPFDDVKNIIEKSLEDGILSQDELDEMFSLFENLTSPTDACACTIEGDSLTEKNICLSGEFEYGSKKEIISLITNAGGIVKSSISKKVDYLIVGNYGNADWACGNYGTKIKRALELAKQGVPIKIIKEDEFVQFIEKEEN